MKLFPESRHRSFTDALRGEYALDPSLIWIGLPITVLTSSWLNWASTGGTLWQWMLVGLYAHFGMVLVGTPVYLLFFKGRKVRALLSISTYALLGVARGTSIAFAARFFALESGPFPIFRPIGGALVNVALLAVTVWFVDGSRNYKALMDQLTTTRATLTAARTQIDEVINSERQRLLELISTNIRGPIEAIQTLALDHGSRSSGAIVSMINETIDQRIKPLSRQLASDIRSWNPSTPAKSSKKTERPSLSSLKVVDPLSPLMLGVVAFLMAPTMFSRYVPLWKATSLAVVCGTLIGASAHLIRGLLSLQKRQISAAVGLVAGTLISAIAFTPAGVAIALTSALDPVQNAFLANGLLAMALGGTFIAASIANEQQRQRTQAALREENRELANAIAQVSGKLWVQQRRIAEILHGQVQSSLIVAAARLMSTNSSADAESVSQLLKPVDAALNELQEEPKPAAMVQFLSELREVWDGVIAIHDTATSEALDVLDASPTTSMIAMTIIRESLGNAHRNGGADRVDISIALEERAIEIVMRNNGALEDVLSPVGLGTQILRAATSTFSRGPVDGVQTLRAMVPVQPSGLT